jgi:hypothetical protein
MASALTSPFHGLPVDEAVPGAMEVHGVSRASILQGRRRIRFQPQTGVQANAGSIIQFVLSDSTGLLDVNSMVLSATVKIDNTTDPAHPGVLDDGPAWCRRVQVLANGSLLEDVDNSHRATNLEVLSCVPQSWYDSEGSFCNFWKMNSTLGLGNGSGVPFHKNNVAAKIAGYAGDLSGNLGAAGGIQMAWPLGLLAPSLRSNKYYPLRSMGELVLQFTCANDAEAVWAPGTEGNPKYLLQDIYLECDIVDFCDCGY